MRFVHISVLGLALAAAACSGVATPSSNHEQTFSGTVSPGTQLGVNTAHTFTVGKTGDLVVKITAVSPDATAVIGVGYGSPFNGGCSFFPGGFTFGRVGSPANVIQTGIQSGTYCVGVFDAGFINSTSGLANTENYTLSVSYP